MAEQSMVLSQQQRLQMVLAPQLRQSLEMLQLPILELRTLVRQELEKNPTLEEVTEQLPPPDAAPAREAPPPPAPASELEEHKALKIEEDYAVLAKLDDEWRDYFFQDQSTHHYTPADEEKRQFFLDSLPQKESLQEHLLQQLDLAGLSENDREIGELIIGSINDDGYLTSKPEELAESAALDLARILDVLSVIQDFDPIGVGARDPRECLLLQLVRLGKSDTLAHKVVSDHLGLLASHKYQDIARILQVSPEEVQKAAEFISTLDPKPGRAYSTDTATYVLPEVLVQKMDGEYVIILNDENLPHVRISNLYRKLMNDGATTPEVKDYIMEKIRSGLFLIKSIHQRQRTLHRIASEIVRFQSDFLDRGVEHLKPLTMSQVAEVVGVHETTVSRAVAGKYMQTPRGVLDMKYFFTPGFKTAEGADISNETVKNEIAQMVSQEDPSHPLSDQEIVGKLTEKGIKVARRTVAKYRLLLRIAPSHMRKSF